MVAKHYGKHFTLETLRERAHISREGVSLLGISRAAESIKFRTTGVKLSFEDLKVEAPLPAISLTLVFLIISLYNAFEVPCNIPSFAM
ncbi:MAG: cysteine peptidase family C39 domain-containing protein [Salinivirgaceae bacterium]|nr:cysteine peptidase family C39 domain-containing protein [Salinivirgaceae bacterium]